MRASLGLTLPTPPLRDATHRTLEIKEAGYRIDDHGALQVDAATAAALRTESGARLRALSLPARQLREWREEHAA